MSTDIEAAVTMLKEEQVTSSCRLPAEVNESLINQQSITR